MKIHEAERIKSCTHGRKEIEACESIIKLKSENENRLSSVVKDLQGKCHEYIKDKNQIEILIQNQFCDLETKLTTKIEEAMNTKTPTPQIQEIPKSKRSYATAAKNAEKLNISNMKQLIRSEKIEEQLEDQRKGRQYHHRGERR